VLDDVGTRILEARDAALERRPFVVGIAGGVGVGKTTLADQLRAQLGARGVTATVLTTDNFLHPNDELGRRGKLMEKGFPDTYDVALIVDTIATLRRDEIAVVPVYSHQQYDRIDETIAVPVTDVLLMEGVNVLQPDIAAVLDFSIYIDVDEDDARAWFFDRFAELAREGEGFYAAFVAMDESERRAIAESAWTGINVVNLRDHIAPTMIRADLVVRKSATHAIVELQARGAG
jgi:type I pantothenate kinase